MSEQEEEELDRLAAEEALRRLADPNEVSIPYDEARKQLGLPLRKKKGTQEMERPTIPEEEFLKAIETHPVPEGFSWQLDPAASSDRMRLFCKDKGEVGGAYPDGRVYASSATFSLRAVTHQHIAECASLSEACTHLVEIAQVLGWW